MNNFPIQTLSLSEKLKLHDDDKKVPKWVKQTSEYLTYFVRKNLRYREEMDNLYKVTEGEFDFSSLKYVENPYHTDKEEFTRFPARLRNFNIIKPVIDRLLGEMRDLPDTITIQAVNEDIDIEKAADWNKIYKLAVAEHFVTFLQEFGIQTEQEIVPPDLMKLRQKFDRSWVDRRTRRGTIAYKWMKENLNLVEKWIKAYYHWLVVGKCWTRKDIVDNDVIYDVVDPRQIHPVSFIDDIELGEDAPGIVAEYYWSVSTIVDKFKRQLDKDTIDKLYKFEQYYDQYDYMEAGARGLFESNKKGTFHTKITGGIKIEHIVWKSKKLRRILKFRTDEGYIEEVEVDEEYKMNKQAGDLEIDEVWENEIWEVWRIPNFNPYDDPKRKDKEEGNYSAEGCSYYLQWGPHEVQRNEINNTSICKGPYNGISNTMIYEDIQSVAKTGLPYQELYNIFFYRFELTLAKNKDKLAVIPMGLLPKGRGWSVEKTMYQIAAMGYLFINEQNERALAALQAVKEIDLSLAKYMQDMWVFLAQIRDLYRDEIGFTRQRYGEARASDLKGVNDQAIHRSSMATRNLVDRFLFFKATDVEGLLDYTKVAWIDGKQSKFIYNKGDRLDMMIPGIEYMESEFGVAATSALREKEDLEATREYAKFMLQNGLPNSLLPKILAADSTVELNKLLELGDEIQQQFEEANRKAEIQKEQIKEQAETQRNRENNQTRIKVAEIQARSRIETALLTAESFIGSDGEGTIAEDEERMQGIIDRSAERISQYREQENEMTARREEAALKREELQVKREEMATELKIAKENKNRHDN